jgi:hypothetical protein
MISLRILSDYLTGCKKALTTDNIGKSGNNSNYDERKIAAIDEFKKSIGQLKIVILNSSFSKVWLDADKEKLVHAISEIREYLVDIKETEFSHLNE